MVKGFLAMKRYASFYLAITLLIITGFLFTSISANSIQGPIIQLTVEEAIGPATDNTDQSRLNKGQRLMQTLGKI